MQRTLIGACAAILMFALPAAADPVTPATGSYANSSSHTAYVRDYNGNHFNAQASDTLSNPLPLSGTVSASLEGVGSSTASHNTQYGTSGAVIRTDFSLSVDSDNATSYYDYAQSYGYFYFDVTEDVTYDITGAYAGTGSEVSTWQFGAQLHQLQPSSNQAYYEYQTEYNSAADLHLGDTSGHHYNVNGQQSGVLTAGTYRLHYWGHVQDRTSGPGDASGSGFVELKLGDGVNVNAVPEPGTYALLGLAGLVICLRRRT